MKETFFQSFSNDLSKAWRNVLELQAEYFSPKVNKYFSNYGMFESSSPLLDLGCGIGAYSLLLKKQFPSLKIIAADANDDFLKILSDKITEKKIPDIETVHWKAGHEPAPNIVKECSAVALRLVLQHIKEPINILSTLKNNLKSGSKIFIIEEDDGYFQIYPENSGFQKYLNPGEIMRITT